MSYKLSASVAVQSGPTPILYSNGSIWVGNLNSASVQRINPATNSVTATIGLTSLSEPVSLAEDDLGNVWVACQNPSFGGVSIIDPATNAVTALSLSPSNQWAGLGMGAGEMWVSYKNPGGFVRYNTTTRAITSGGSGAGTWGHNFVYDGTNVWFADTNGINKVAPATNVVTRITAGVTGSSSPFLHYAFGYVWFVTQVGIGRVDTSTNAVTAIVLSSFVCLGITDDGTNLIVTSNGGELIVVDPTSFAVKQRITSSDSYWRTTFDGSSIWVNDFQTSGLCKKFIDLPVGWVRGHAWG